jgi:hypothetical protein
MMPKDISNCGGSLDSPSHWGETYVQADPEKVAAQEDGQKATKSPAGRQIYSPSPDKTCCVQKTLENSCEVGSE